MKKFFQETNGELKNSSRYWLNLLINVILTTLAAESRMIKKIIKKKKKKKKKEQYPKGNKWAPLQLVIPPTN